LVLVRHGRTAWNRSGRFQGQADPPLDDTGLAQAIRAASELRHLAPDAIVSSDLLRAAQTASAIGTHCGLPVRFQPALREVALGQWEGLWPADAELAFPDEYAAWRAGAEVRRGGGETERAAGERALTALQALWREGGDGQTTIVVSHGLVLRSVLRLLGHRPPVRQPATAVPDLHLGNGEWISVRLASVR
jgi:probable phosphoglycerate mutase